jgi:hypothetical protein
VSDDSGGCRRHDKMTHALSTVGGGGGFRKQWLMGEAEEEDEYKGVVGRGCGVWSQARLNT